MHVGRLYPIWFLVNYSNAGGVTINAGPTRKLTIESFNFQATPTAREAVWMGFTNLVSDDVVQRDPANALKSIYEWTNPTNSDAVLRCTVQFKATGLLTTTQGMSWYYRWNYFWAGVDQGYHELSPGYEYAFFSTPLSDHWVGQNWVTVVNPAVFRGIGIHARPASWAEQPEYRPRSLGP